MNKAVILVAFGSANLDGIKNSIGLLQKDLNKSFGDEYTIVKAFTSNRIIDLLKERHDYVVPHLSKAIFNLINHGYEEIVLQPLHILNGNDKKQVDDIVEEYKYSLRKLAVSKSLFSTEENSLIDDSYKVAKIIIEDLDEKAILLLGHGSKENSNNKLYDILEEAVREISGRPTYMATLEGEKNINNVIEALKKDNIKSLNIKSLFIVSGKHVINDISLGENSLIGKIKSEGIDVEMSNNSLLQYKKIRNIYIENIKSTIK